MDWPNAFVSIGAAVAVAIATSLVAIKSLASQRKVAEEDRKHARELAEADRAHDLGVRRADRRADAYFELMKALHRLQMGVDRSEPMLSRDGDPGPPPNLSDEEAWTLQARTDVVASDEVRAMIEAWFEKARDFYNALWLLNVIREQERRGLVTTEKLEQDFGVKSSVGQWQKMHDIRVELRQAVLAVGAQIRAEV